MRDAGRPDSGGRFIDDDESDGGSDGDSFVLDVDVIEATLERGPATGAHVRVDDVNGVTLEAVTDDNGRARFSLDPSSKPWAVTAAEAGSSATSIVGVTGALRDPLVLVPGRQKPLPPSAPSQFRRGAIRGRTLPGLGSVSLSGENIQYFLDYGDWYEVSLRDPTRTTQARAVEYYADDIPYRVSSVEFPAGAADQSTDIVFSSEAPAREAISISMTIRTPTTGVVVGLKAPDFQNGSSNLVASTRPAEFQWTITAQTPFDDSLATANLVNTEAWTTLSVDALVRAGAVIDVDPVERLSAEGVDLEHLAMQFQASAYDLATAILAERPRTANGFAWDLWTVRFYDGVPRSKQAWPRLPSKVSLADLGFRKTTDVRLSVGKYGAPPDAGSRIRPVTVASHWGGLEIALDPGLPSACVPEKGACNGVDDDCDSVVDEKAECTPVHDTCGDALDVSAGGTFFVDPAGAAVDYSVGCFTFPDGLDDSADIAFTFTLDEKRDVTMAARGSGDIPLTLFGEACDPPNESIDCGLDLRLRALPAGTYHVVALTQRHAPLFFHIEFSAPQKLQKNLACPAAIDISGGGRFGGDLLGKTAGTSFGCDREQPALYYRFDLESARDVELSLNSRNLGPVSLDVRTACDNSTSSIACMSVAPIHRRLRSLAPGTYYAVVGGFDQAFDLDVEFSSPTKPAKGGSCDRAIELTLGEVAKATFYDKEDRIELACACAGDPSANCRGYAVESVFHFKVDEAADFDISVVADDAVRASLGTNCDDAASADSLFCGSVLGLLDGKAVKLKPGDYYLIVETRNPALEASVLVEPAH